MMQPSPQECFLQLKSLLQRQSADLEAINGYLRDIKSAIANNHIEQLSQLLTQQRLPLTEIEDLETQRHKLLKHNGFESNKKGLQACIDWCDGDSVLADQYQVFEESLIKLQRSIQLNSLLVNKGQKRIRQSLHLLTGQSSDNARTYSSAGQTQEIPSKRSIAQA